MDEQEQAAAAAEVAFNIAAAELCFYGVVFLAAALSGLWRSIRDDDYQSVWNLVAVGLCSGFLGFSVISILCWSDGGASGYQFRYWGVASLVGLLGKEQDKLIRWLVRQVFSKLGIEDDGFKESGDS